MAGQLSEGLKDRTFRGLKSDSESGGSAQREASLWGGLQAGLRWANCPLMGGGGGLLGGLSYAPVLGPEIQCRPVGNSLVPGVRLTWIQIMTLATIHCAIIVCVLFAITPPAL